MPMTGFFCQDEYLAKTTKLTDEEVGRLFRALMKYHANGEIVDLDVRESIAFDFIREDIDKAEEAYANKCRQASENRRKGLNQNSTNDNARQRQSTSVNETDHNNINKNNDNKKEINKRNNTRVTPPTLEEVTEYCRSRNNGVDPQRFIDFYASKGWMVGKNPMKDWKACVRTWEERDKGQKKVIAQDFTQRDYSDVPDQMMDELARDMEAFRKEVG